VSRQTRLTAATFRLRVGIVRVAGASVLVAMLAGCSGQAAGSPVPIEAGTGSEASSVAAAASPVPGSPVPPSPAARAPSPVCADRRPPALERSPNPAGDGTPDPAGRIAFGPVSRYDDALGQVIGPLYAIDADGSDLVRILGCEVERPRFSPDGRWLAFSIVMDDDSLQVATMRVDGSDLHILTDTAGYAMDPDWSADGTWLVYSHAPQHCDAAPACYDQRLVHPTLWRMNADGSGPEPSRLSPDGLELVFDRNDPATGVQALTIRNLGTGAERRVTTTNTGDITHPDWSRDSRSIIYNTETDGSGNQLIRIERLPADDPAAAPVALCCGPEQRAFKPADAPDGQRLVFGCDGNICLMDEDGTNVEVLIGAPGLELNHPAWGRSAPDG
jgi:hypothetical protein